MEKSEKIVFAIIGILFIAFVGGLVWFKVFQVQNEAQTFNKFSEIKATAWDAFWADLRVEACRNNN